MQIFSVNRYEKAKNKIKIYTTFTKVNLTNRLKLKIYLLIDIATKLTYKFKHIFYKFLICMHLILFSKQYI